jgi:hypothetical protein
MKLNVLHARRPSLRGAVAVGALLVLGGFTAGAQAQYPPYGTTWDCLLSGSGQQGIAFLTFSNDFTFTGYQLLVGKQSAARSSGSERNAGGDTGRGTSANTNAPIGGGTNLFGFGPVSGPWRYDVKGQVVGYFLELINQQTSITTNLEIKEVFHTNYTPVYEEIRIVQTNTIYLTNTTATTNGVSFQAKVVPGKRLTLASSTPYGKVTYKGVPQNSKSIPAPISGSWYGAKKENKQDFVEFFSLLPTSLQNPYLAGAPNIFFTTNGNGPGFSFGGVSMVSVQKKIGFALETFQGVVTNIATATGGTLSATLGSINYPAKGAKANTKGFEDPIVPISFQAQRQGP